jgi:hypothetical protein
MLVATAELGGYPVPRQETITSNTHVEISDSQGKRWGPPIFKEDEYQSLVSDSEFGLKPILMSKINDPSKPIPASQYDFIYKQAEIEFNAQYEALGLMRNLQIFKFLAGQIKDTVNLKSHPENSLMLASMGVSMLGMIGESPVPAELTPRISTALLGLAVGWGWGKDFSKGERARNAVIGAAGMVSMSEAANVQEKFASFRNRIKPKNRTS